MNLFWVLPIALALALDAFAVAVGLSVAPQGLKRPQVLRLGFFFGFFQFMMPLVGWLMGKGLFHYIHRLDHWVAFGLLCLIGGKMIRASFQDIQTKGGNSNDPTAGWTLIVLSIATSVDALAVGLSFAALEAGIFYPSLIFGIVAFFLTLAGTKLGPMVGRLAGNWAEFFGGLLLILIGIKILVEHL
jgi:putative Mn2+ efflux pump MntP